MRERLSRRRCQTRLHGGEHMNFEWNHPQWQMLIERLEAVNEDRHILSNVRLRWCGERRIGIKINSERQQPPHQLKLPVKEYGRSAGKYLTKNNFIFFSEVLEH